MKPNVLFAVAVCKLAQKAARLLKRGGTAMPGRVALRFCPGLLGELSRGVKTVLITGTNGKTTSARMVEQAFQNAGLNYFANRSGANLISGITTEFAIHATLSGRAKCEYAVIECDEAASKTVLQYLKPSVILVTNVFRDQLDRYGEVTHTLNNIREGLSHVPEAVLCLNADCSLTASLADLPNRVVFYGLNVPVYDHPIEEVSDAPHCIRCKTEYVYDWRTYGHLGGFRCPSCGYCRPAPQVAVTRIVSLDADSSAVELDLHGEALALHIGLPAAYNIYNAAGSAAALHELGFAAADIIAALASFNCGFGRMEKFRLGEVEIRMILVKNPAGCNQVMNFLSTLSEPALFAVCLNDRGADGTDVSWIWDADFEKLTALGDRLSGVLVSGVRADDLHVRLKYAGLPEERLQVFHDYDRLIEALGAQDKPVFVMPTYTAMLELREKLRRLCGGGEFWE